MILMVSGASAVVAECAADPAKRKYLGAMITPNTGNAVASTTALGIPWCMDNAAFDATRFNPAKFLARCREVAAADRPPVFVTVPDQVGNHECTRYLFDVWADAMEDAGLGRLPKAFVAQNGLDWRNLDDVPWREIAAVFVGGDDDFKMGDFVAQDLIPEARRRGKWVHVGRVNSRARLRWCMSADADSIDGSSMAMFSRTYVPKFCRWAAELEAEGRAQDALVARMADPTWSPPEPWASSPLFANA